MGGGSTVVEAYALGRRAVGADINSLSCFVTRVKVTPLTAREIESITAWADHAVQSVRYGDQFSETDDARLREIPRNMTLPQARAIRKTIALCLSAAEASLPTATSRRFARCVMLNVGQWALNGRRCIPCTGEFRTRVSVTCAEMLAGLRDLRMIVRESASSTPIARPVLVETDAERLHETEILGAHGPADMVVTSPPYPGVHMLYHRWQVDGRKETDAPYWIAACNDGEGAVGCACS